MCSGVRQGSILYPALFNIFINAFIVNLKSCGIGCHVYNQYFGCLLYADDIILLSPSVACLQDMLNICNNTASFLALDFNPKKCHCITFGKNASSVSECMSIGSFEIEWCTNIKYLGVYIVSGKRLAFDVDPVKRSFYSACNSIFSQASNMDEIMHLSLQETYCLPVLPACIFKRRQLVELKV